MAKAGQSQGTTTKKKDFAGTGVQGQKGQAAAQVPGTPPEGGAAPPAAEQPKAQKAAAPDQEPKVITGEQVLKNLREKGHQV